MSMQPDVSLSALYQLSNVLDYSNFITNAKARSQSLIFNLKNPYILY